MTPTTRRQCCYTRPAHSTGRTAEGSQPHIQAAAQQARRGARRRHECAGGRVWSLCVKVPLRPGVEFDDAAPAVHAAVLGSLPWLAPVQVPALPQQHVEVEQQHPQPDGVQQGWLWYRQRQSAAKLGTALLASAVPRTPRVLSSVAIPGCVQVIVVYQLPDSDDTVHGRATHPRRRTLPPLGGVSVQGPVGRAAAAAEEAAEDEGSGEAVLQRAIEQALLSAVGSAAQAGDARRMTGDAAGTATPAASELPSLLSTAAMPADEGNSGIYCCPAAIASAPGLQPPQQRRQVHREVRLAPEDQQHQQAGRASASCGRRELALDLLLPIALIPPVPVAGEVCTVLRAVVSQAGCVVLDTMLQPDTLMDSTASYSSDGCGVCSDLGTGEPAALLWRLLLPDTLDCPGTLWVHVVAHNERAHAEEEGNVAAVASSVAVAAAAADRQSGRLLATLCVPVLPPAAAEEVCRLFVLMQQDAAACAGAGELVANDETTRPYATWLLPPPQHPAFADDVQGAAVCSPCYCRHAAAVYEEFFAPFVVDLTLAVDVGTGYGQDLSPGLRSSLHEMEQQQQQQEDVGRTERLQATEWDEQHQQLQAPPADEEQGKEVEDDSEGGTSEERRLRRQQQQQQQQRQQWQEGAEHAREVDAYAQWSAPQDQEMLEDVQPRQALSVPVFEGLMYFLASQGMEASWRLLQQLRRPPHMQHMQQLKHIQQYCPQREQQREQDESGAPLKPDAYQQARSRHRSAAGPWPEAAATTGAADSSLGIVRPGAAALRHRRGAAATAREHVGRVGAAGQAHAAGPTAEEDDTPSQYVGKQDSRLLSSPCVSDSSSIGAWTAGMPRQARWQPAVSARTALLGFADHLMESDYVAFRARRQRWLVQFSAWVFLLKAASEVAHATRAWQWQAAVEAAPPLLSMAVTALLHFAALRLRSPAGLRRWWEPLLACSCFCFMAGVPFLTIVMGMAMREGWAEQQGSLFRDLAYCFMASVLLPLCVSLRPKVTVVLAAVTVPWHVALLHAIGQWPATGLWLHGLAYVCAQVAVAVWLDTRARGDFLLMQRHRQQQQQQQRWQ